MNWASYDGGFSLFCDFVIDPAVKKDSPSFLINFQNKCLKR